MIIETVKIQEDGYFVNGTMFVPNDPANRHYQAILDWINEGNTPEGPDVIEPDYVALRTGPEGYAPIHEQLAMQTDGTWDAHIADVKTRFPKTITGGTTIGDVPTELIAAADAKLFSQQLADYIEATVRLAREAIDSVDATVEQTTYDEDDVATTTTIENPLITQDNAERAAAQAIVDATPQAVKDAA